MRIQKGLLAGSTALGLLIGGAGLANAADAPKVEQRTPVYACKVTGFWELPGTDICFKVGGYAKADFAYSSERITTENVFNEAAIRTIDFAGNNSGDKDRLKFASTESRLNFDARSATEYGTVRAFIEGHFFTGNDTSADEAFSSGKSFNLRHAYVQVGNLLAGRFWSTYNDFQLFYESSNFTGPQAQTFTRINQIRWTQQVGNGVSVQLALENPESISRAAGAAQVVGGVGPNGFARVANLNVAHNGDDEVLPNAVGVINIQQAWGGVTLSGVAREVVLRNTLSGSDQSKFGWGGQATFKIRMPFGNSKNHINGGGQYSDGAGAYHSFAKNQTGDGFVRAAGQSLQLFETWGAAIGGQVWVTDSVRLNGWVSYNEVLDTNLSGADEAFLADNLVGENSWRVGGNVAWTVVPRLDVFLEANWGRLEDFAGNDGEAFRVNASIQRSF